MKKITLGIFMTRSDAEEAINRLHRDHKINHENISYIYKNTEGEIKEVDSEDVSSSTPKEGAATGAKVGGTLGALAGIAAFAGAIPVIGPIFAAGPLLAALGVTGSVIAGAATGAAAGGLIGALVAWGVDKEHAQDYADRVKSGDILVVVHAEENKNVASTLTDAGATEVKQYTPTV